MTRIGRGIESFHANINYKCIFGNTFIIFNVFNFHSLSDFMINFEAHLGIGIYLIIVNFILLTLFLTAWVILSTLGHGNYLPFPNRFTKFSSLLTINPTLLVLLQVQRNCLQVFTTFGGLSWEQLPDISIWA